MVGTVLASRSAGVVEQPPSAATSATTPRIRIDQISPKARSPPKRNLRARAIANARKLGSKGVDFRAGEVEGGFVDNVSLANLARQPERARQLHPLEPIPVWFI